MGLRGVDRPSGTRAPGRILGPASESRQRAGCGEGAGAPAGAFSGTTWRGRGSDPGRLRQGRPACLGAAGAGAEGSLIAHGVSCGTAGASPGDGRAVSGSGAVVPTAVRGPGWDPPAVTRDASALASGLPEMIHEPTRRGAVDRNIKCPAQKAEEPIARGPPPPDRVPGPERCWHRRAGADMHAPWQPPRRLRNWQRDPGSGCCPSRRPVSRL